MTLLEKNSFLTKKRRILAGKKGSVYKIIITVYIKFIGSIYYSHPARKFLKKLPSNTLDCQ